MSNSGSNLELYLKLDEIVSAKTSKEIRDFSGNGRNAKFEIEEDFNIVNDALFGKCLHISGLSKPQKGIEIDSQVIPTGDEITISFWARFDRDISEKIELIKVSDNNNEVISVSFENSANHHKTNFKINDFMHSISNSVSLLHWNYFAFTNNAKTGKNVIFKDGLSWHSQNEGNRKITKVVKARLLDSDQHFKGKLAHFRIYNRALSYEDLWRDMALSLISHFDKSSILPSLLPQSLDNLKMVNPEIYEKTILDMAATLDDDMREKVKHKFREFQQDRNWESIRQLFDLKT